MGIIPKDTPYVIKRLPVNREERRKADKEYKEVQRACLSVVLAYLDTENKTDDLRREAKKVYIDACNRVNNRMVFVNADIHFFDKHFPTKEKIKEIISPRKPVKVYAAVLFLLIVAIITLCIFF